ncbi:peptidase M16 inactive domain-containing protein [Toxoplasma gondii RUB]|uniref:Peptidase M16 inactive domain-containing protein n=1 Tax=Toxoplasma gondii RUB TaxID=935652 RepID=A0A086M0Q3_TOXGO|nr:peptidase M16 inactive domain-containing protein [Toxoplasma gondii RUB]
MAPPPRNSQEKSKKAGAGESSRSSRGHHSRQRNRSHHGSSRRTTVMAAQDTSVASTRGTDVPAQPLPHPSAPSDRVPQTGDLSAPHDELTLPAATPTQHSTPAHFASGGKAWRRRSTDASAGEEDKTAHLPVTNQRDERENGSADLSSHTQLASPRTQHLGKLQQAEPTLDGESEQRLQGEASSLRPDPHQKNHLSFESASALTASGLPYSPLRSPLSSADPSLSFDQSCVVTPATPASSLVCTPEPGPLSTSCGLEYLSYARSPATSESPAPSGSPHAFPVNGETAEPAHAAKKEMTRDSLPVPAVSPQPKQGAAGVNPQEDVSEAFSASGDSSEDLPAAVAIPPLCSEPCLNPRIPRDKTPAHTEQLETSPGDANLAAKLPSVTVPPAPTAASVSSPTGSSRLPPGVASPPSLNGDASGVSSPRGLNGDGCAVSSRPYRAALQSVSATPLAFWPALRLGRLRNGLEYRILQHAFPAHKIAAHLVVHAGSVHEEENEQGLAHLLEHCVFQGTRKFPSAAQVRRELGALGMSFGGDLNAYTDFHHTAYTLHSPVETPNVVTEAQAEELREEKNEGETSERSEENNKEKNEEKSNLERCLVLLRELVFAPLLEDGESLEAERQAVLSEEQLRHSVQYRVEKKMYEHLHGENILARRFPIGLTEQVKKMTAEDLRRFKRRWYRPANAVLLVVADEDADAVVELAEQVFSPVSPDGEFREEAKQETDRETEKEAVLRFLHRKAAPQDAISWAEAGAQLAKPGGALLPRHPDVYEAPSPREAVFQHHLLKGLVVIIAAKEEISPLRTMRDFFVTLVDTCISCIFHTRLNDSELARRDPLFLSATWNYSNSARENCAWNTLTVAAASLHSWPLAVQEAVEQVVALCRFGVDSAELRWAVKSLRKSYRDSMAQQDCQDGESLLEEIVETLTTGCIFTSRKQEFEAFESLAEFITPEVVQARCQEVFYHILHFFDEYRGSAETPRASLFVYGPTHERFDEDLSLRFLSPLCTQSPLVSRGNSDLVPQSSLPFGRRVTRTVSHSTCLVLPGGEGSEDEAENFSENAAFAVTAEEVETAIAKALAHQPAPASFHLPDALLDREKLDASLAENPPKFIPPLMRNRLKLHGPSAEEVRYRFSETDGFLDEETEIQFWRFENGASVNAKSTNFEPSRCQVRLFFFGGELMAQGDERQLLDLGIRTLMDGGLAGHLQKNVDKLCALWGIYVSAHVEPEGVSLTVTFDTAQEEACDHAFELIHSYLEYPAWSEDVFERQKQFMKTSYEMSLSSLDFLASVALTYQLYPGDRRWVPANSSQLDSYTLEQARAAVERQLQPHLLEVCVVGEFKVDELKRVVTRYIGSLKAKLPVDAASRAQFEDGSVPDISPIIPFKRSKFVAPFLEEKQQAERCAVTVALPGFGRYDFEKKGDQASFQASPSYRFRVWRFIEEIINNRLHDEMREKRQLGYSFSCHTAALEFQDVGFLLFAATPLPAFAAKAWDALCAVIRSLCTTNPPSKDEYLAAKQVVTSGFSTSFKTNEYWMALLFGLQLPTSPKDLDSIKRIPEFYERVSPVDIFEVMRATLFASPMISCIAISGPREIKGLPSRVESAVEAKLTRQLLARSETSPPLPWEDTQPWEEDLGVDAEWDAISRRGVLGSGSRLFSPASVVQRLSRLLNKKESLLLLSSLAALGALIWLSRLRQR